MKPVPFIIMGPYHLWFHVARLRRDKGDIEGAKRAIRNARMMSNRKMFEKFSMDNYRWI